MWLKLSRRFVSIRCLHSVLNDVPRAFLRVLTLPLIIISHSSLFLRSSNNKIKGTISWVKVAMLQVTFFKNLYLKMVKNGKIRIQR